jgi:hypothetical protein
MFKLFKSAPFIDPQLGEFHRSWGKWRGTIKLDAESSVPLVLSGRRASPDPEALRIAQKLPYDYPALKKVVEKELFEHYSPYAEAVAAGEEDPPSSGLPRIDTPSSVWSHTTLEYVQVSPLDGILSVEIGYRVAWDEEHTLGARFRNDKLLELCGSVLAP